MLLNESIESLIASFRQFCAHNRVFRIGPMPFEIVQTVSEFVIEDDFQSRVVDFNRSSHHARIRFCHFNDTVTAGSIGMVFVETTTLAEGCVVENRTGRDFFHPNDLPQLFDEGWIDGNAGFSGVGYIGV